MIPWNTVGKEEPKKSLDEKLEQLLKALVFDEWHDDSYLPSYKKAIKQAFVDEGWVHSSTPQAQMLQEMSNLRAQMKADAVRLGLSLSGVDHE